MSGIEVYSLCRVCSDFHRAGAGCLVENNTAWNAALVEAARLAVSFQGTSLLDLASQIRGLKR